MRFIRLPSQFILLSFALLCANNAAIGSGFQLFEQSVSMNGQAGVASRAVANDASIEFYNPAGLTRLSHPQFVWSGMWATVDLAYKGSNTFNGMPPLLPGLPSEYGKTQGGKEVILPSAYYAHPLSEDWVFAFGVWSPFGLVTDYSANSLVRYSATRTSLKVIDFSPALAYRVNEHWSVGGALDVQYAKVDFDSRFPMAVLGAPVGTPDAKITNTGDDWALGWHAGLLYEYSANTRVGMSYHSKTRHHFKGDSEFTSVVPTVGLIRSNHLSAKLTLPSYASLGVYHDFTPRLAGMASVDYTHWSTLGTVTLKNVAFPGGPVENSFVQNYHDSWRYGVAAHFKATPTWLWRAGVAYDQTPTSQSARSIRLPDGDRAVVAVGNRWQINDEVGIDISYMHIFIADGKLRNPANVGKSTNSADILGAQLTWDFV